MAPHYDGHDYYKKMLELQEKLRKSEEERIRLEERFKILTQESRNRHDACINRLRLKYIDFLEEQRTRDERNHKLLGALDRVDSNLALMSAKTDRLNVLRKQYEAYLLRVYANRGLPGSITGDSGIASQSGDRCLKRNIIGQVDPVSPEVKSISPSQIYRPNNETNQRVSNFAPKLNEQTQNVSYSNRQMFETVPLGMPRDVNYPQMNPLDNKNTSQIHVTPSFQETRISPQNLASDVHQQPQTYYDSNLQPSLHNFQVNSNLRIPCAASVPQISPLSQQNVLRINKFPAERMETVQTMPGLTISAGTNGNVQQYKSLDISRNQATPPASEFQFNQSPITQTHRQHNKSLLNNSHPHLRNSESINVPISRTAPAITESNILGKTFLNTSLSYPRQISPRSRYLHSSLRSSRDVKKSFGEIPKHSLTTSDIDDMLRRHERYTSKPFDDTRRMNKFSSITKQAPEEREQDGGRATTILEDELDRYIGRIRNLHRDYDMQSLDELDHEQNTSGDLLNVTLSDDDLELPTEDKVKEDQLPTEVEKVLALANDLASTMVDENDVDDFEKEDGSENRNAELMEMAQSNAPVLERTHDTLLDTGEGRGTPTALAKDEISNDIALHRSELDLHENIEKPAEQESDSPHIHTGQELVLEQQLFDVVDELEPWRLDLVEKQIREMDISDVDNDQSIEKEEVSGVSIPSQEGEQEDVAPKELSIPETAVDNVEVMEKETPNTSDLDDTKNVPEPTLSELADTEKDSYEIDKLKSDENSTLENKETERNDQIRQDNENVQEVNNSMEQNVEEEKNSDEKVIEDSTAANSMGDVIQSDQPQTIESSDEYVADQQYVDESKQDQEYAQDPQQPYTDLNQEYPYEQNVQYEGNQGQGQDIQEYVPEYGQDSNEQYGEYTGEQYDQYADNADNQYDPNVQYEQDPNQEYAYNYDQQYDPNQVYENDQNQSYAYEDNCDPNQSGVAQSEDYAPNEKQENPQEESQNHTAEQITEAKSDMEDNKSQEQPLEDQPKKKKDVIKSLLDSDTESTIERNVSNTESDFDFN